MNFFKAATECCFNLLNKKRKTDVLRLYYITSIEKNRRYMWIKRLHGCAVFFNVFFEQKTYKKVTEIVKPANYLDLTREMNTFVRCGNGSSIPFFFADLDNRDDQCIQIRKIENVTKNQNT